MSCSTSRATATPCSETDEILHGHNEEGSIYIHKKREGMCQDAVGFGRENASPQVPLSLLSCRHHSSLCSAFFTYDTAVSAHSQMSGCEGWKTYTPTIHQFTTKSVMVSTTSLVNHKSSTEFCFIYIVVRTVASRNFRFYQKSLNIRKKTPTMMRR